MTDLRDSESNSVLEELTELIGKAIRNFSDVLCQEVKRLRHQAENIRKESTRLANRIQDLEQQPAAALDDVSKSRNASYAERGMQTMTTPWDLGLAVNLQDATNSEGLVSRSTASGLIKKKEGEDDEDSLGFHGLIEIPHKVGVILPQTMAMTHSGHNQNPSSTTPPPSVDKSLSFLEDIQNRANQLSDLCLPMRQYGARSKEGSCKDEESEEEGEAVKKARDGQGRGPEQKWPPTPYSKAETILSLGKKKKEVKGEEGSESVEKDTDQSLSYDDELGDMGEMDEEGEWSAMAHKELRDCILSFMDNMLEYSTDMLHNQVLRTLKYNMAKGLGDELHPKPVVGDNE
ncbi:hypothetical protein ACOMHN_015425 [Nucella lapillus]